MISQQMNGGTGTLDGFAQNNELAIQLFHSGGGGTFPGGGFFPFIQRSFAAASGTDSLGLNATWNGVDGTRTITWNLAAFTVDDPTTPDPTAVSISQILTDHPDMQGAAIYFVQQHNGPAPVGPGRFFWDNVRLLDAGGAELALIGNFEPIPEPGSMALAALAVPPLVVAYRRRRAARTATATV
jgi:hypothetical protein